MTVVPPEATPQDPEGHLWDVIVIGAGAGGSTAGFNLARLDARCCLLSGENFFIMILRS